MVETTDTTTDAVAAMPTAASDTADINRVRTVCVALLGQLSKLEDELKKKELDYEGFSDLIDELEVACDESDKRGIFAMIDEDGGGTIDSKEIKSAVRNSGAIETMYQDSLKTFGLLLAATLVFDGGILALKGGEAAFDFLAAYFVEDSLSVDNLFVFLLLFRYFKVPPQLVDICLNYGIAGSIVLRGAFIFAGIAAISAFKPVLLGFAGFLIFSSYSALTGGGDNDDDDDGPPELVTNLLEQLPLTGTFEGEKFFVDGAGGSGVQATQLTATLLCIALCDVLFAVDSIPAVLAVTDDPLIVYTSNIAAVVGLRALYQLLSVAVSDLIYLETAVAVVLGFVGVKLGLEVLGVDVSSGLSLGFIITTLGGGILLSQTAPAEEREAYEPSPSSSFLKWLTLLTSGEKKDD
jgi:TerC family integral membrane protein